MTPRKMVDGDIVHDPEFGRLSWLAQLLWDRLWLMSDAWGRGEWNELVLKVECFPADTKVTAAKVKLAMDELVKNYHGLTVYEAREQVFFQLLEWETVFKGKYRAASWIPAPPTDAGKQMKLDVQRQSTDISAQNGQKVHVPVPVEVKVEVESPSGKKLVEKSGKLTKEELLSMVKAGEDVGFEDIKHLSFKDQKEIKAAVSKPAAAVLEGKPPDIMTDEEVAEQEQCTLGKAREKRAKGMVFYKGGHR